MSTVKVFTDELARRMERLATRLEEGDETIHPACVEAMKSFVAGIPPEDLAKVMRHAAGMIQKWIEEIV